MVDVSDRKLFILAHTEARRRAVQAVSEAADGWRVIVEPPKRGMAQNAAMWAALTDLSAQVVWHGAKLTPEEWKDVMTAALKRQKVVPGIDGGFVVIGAATSRMTKPVMSELLELIHAFGAQHGVTFA